MILENTLLCDFYDWQIFSAVKYFINEFVVTFYSGMYKTVQPNPARFLEIPDPVVAGSNPAGAYTCIT